MYFLMYEFNLHHVIFIFECRIRNLSLQAFSYLIWAFEGEIGISLNPHKANV